MAELGADPATGIPTSMACTAVPIVTSDTNEASTHFAATRPNAKPPGDSPGLLPNARLVVDHFHMTKLVNDAVRRAARARSQ